FLLASAAASSKKFVAVLKTPVMSGGTQPMVMSILSPSCAAAGAATMAGQSATVAAAANNDAFTSFLNIAPLPIEKRLQCAQRLAGRRSHTSRSRDARQSISVIQLHFYDWRQIIF